MPDTRQIGLPVGVLHDSEAPCGATPCAETPLFEDGIRSELDARQDEVLRLLGELNEQIEAAIREFAPPAADRGEDRRAAA